MASFFCISLLFIISELSTFAHYNHSDWHCTSANLLSLWMKMLLVQKFLLVFCDSRESVLDYMSAAHYNHSVTSGGPHYARHLYRYVWLNDIADVRSVHAETATICKCISGLPGQWAQSQMYLTWRSYKGSLCKLNIVNRQLV